MRLFIWDPLSKIYSKDHRNLVVCSKEKSRFNSILVVCTILGVFFSMQESWNVWLLVKNRRLFGHKVVNIIWRTPYKLLIQWGRWRYKILTWPAAYTIIQIWMRKTKLFPTLCFVDGWHLNPVDWRHVYMNRKGKGGTYWKEKYIV